MSYPYDNPSLSMSTIWQSGSYKPVDAVRTIRDNYTPINKNSMVNSVGQEIALVQNYVNSKYLGRSDLPIQTGYIQESISNSGSVYVYNSGLDRFGNGINPADYTKIYSQKIEIVHVPQDELTATNIIESSGFYITGSNSQSYARSRALTIYPEQIYVYGSGPTLDGLGAYGLSNWSLNILPYSGINMTHTDYLLGDSNDFNLSPSGISWNFTDVQNTGLFTKATRLDVDRSGQYISLPNGRFVVNSGEPYANTYEFTVKGSMYLQTNGGSISLTGDNAMYDRIISTASDSLNIRCGSTILNLHSSGVMGLPVDASSTQTVYDLANAIKALLIERGLATAI